MSPKSKKPLLLKDLLVEKVAAEGRCVAYHEGRVVFIDGQVAPGDRVDVRLLKQKKNYWLAEAIQSNEASSWRSSPFCGHFGVCGGCKWQHLQYEAQLKMKEQQLRDAFERIAKVQVAVWEPILPAESTQYYRNKLDFAFSNRRWLLKEEIADAKPLERLALGFHVSGRFDRIVDITHCYLQADPSNAIRLAARAFAIEQNISFYDNLTHQGVLRSLIIRTANTGDVMVTLVYAHDRSAACRLADFLLASFPAISSLYLMHNTKANDNYYDLTAEHYAGAPYIREQMGHLLFQIGPKSFFQTNSQQARRLYELIREWANLQGSERIYDLYTGIGSIASFLAAEADFVLGIEYVEEAVEDARRNAAINQINNIAFLAGDMKDVLQPGLIAQYGRPHIVVTDPPRSGMHPAVVEQLLRILPEKIIYVSCNPATQARDVAKLAAAYNVECVRGVDMFPHTHHVESVALLKLR